MRTGGRLGLLLALAGCSGGDSGPYPGPLHSFRIDRIDLPADSMSADLAAADLDHDGEDDNKLGNATAVLAQTQDLSRDAASMIASGALGSTLEIHADDLERDDTASVRYVVPGADPDWLAGRLAAGAFRSGERRDGEWASGSVSLPIFTNADAATVNVSRVHMELAADGAGGYSGFVRGGIELREARQATLAGLVQMFQTEPERHLVFLRSVDTDHDDALSYSELEDSVIGLLVAADVSFEGSGPTHVSFGFAFHAIPCDGGDCELGVPANTCRDRVRDGSETDVDCGGSCQPCWTDKACGVAADCQSQACSGLKCAAPTCTDLVRDGFESDVDCGGVCSPCAAGRTCAAARDCASADCDMGIASVGSCR